MPELSFHLPVFDGPMDLLLHLIAKHKLNIHDIEISILLEQYLLYMQQCAEQDYELAGEFLTMAAKLIWMKTAALLPQQEEAEAVKKEQEAKIKAGERIPEFQDIHIDNVTCTGCQTGIRANGITGTNAIHNIDINNSTITYHGKATDIDATTASLKQNNVRLVSSKITP